MTDQTEKTSESAEDAPMTVEDTVKEALAELSQEGDGAPKEAQDEKQEEQTDEKSEETTAEAPEKVEPATVTVPEWWDGDVEVWTGLTPEAQEFLGKRELARQEAMERDAVSPEVRTALGHITDYAKMYGVSADQALDRLYQAQRLLDANPKHGLAQLARQYGVDLSQIAAVPGDGQVQQADDPLAAVDRLVNERLAQFQHGLEQQQVQTALSELEAWAQEKGDDGKLLRPHFEELQGLVNTEMGRLLEANPRQDRWSALDKAYKTVERVKAPATDMEAEIERRAQEKADALLKAKQAEVAKATKAAVSPASTVSGTATPEGTPNSVEDAVRQSWAELEGGNSARI